MRVKWEGFAASADVGTAVELSSYPDRSVQVLGDFGTGGEITIQGSNDGGTTWATLTDPQGNALVFTSARIEAVTELVQQVRPNATAGSGADIDVYMMFGGATR
jgi:hypothetical protein